MCVSVCRSMLEERAGTLRGNRGVFCVLFVWNTDNYVFDVFVIAGTLGVRELLGS
jgi:hypothetical protein